MPDPDSPGSGAVLALHMPLLCQDGCALRARLTFDPLFPLEPDRTALSLLAPGVPAPSALRSLLTTTLGGRVWLTPVAETPTRWPARLVFAGSPRLVDDPSDPEVYLTPDGAFRLRAETCPGTGAARLALGLSGLEYVDVRDGALVLFRSGHPAYFSAGGDAALGALATTAHVALLPDGAGQLVYYAQPAQSPLYSVRQSGTGFLSLHEMPAAVLGAFEAGASPVFPIGVYQGIERRLIPHAAVLEHAALAPARRSLLPVPDSTDEPDAPAVLVVTPSGLLARLTAEGTGWRQVVLASLPGAPEDQLTLSTVGPRLRKLLQSTEVFAAVTNVDEFFEHSSVGYRVDDAVRASLRGEGVPAEVIDAIGQAAGTRAYETEKAFRAQLGSATIDPRTHADYLDTLLSVAGQLKAVLQEWTFQLSPRSWRTDAASRTVMLIKYASRTLIELAGNTSAWGWPEAACHTAGGPSATRDLVLGILDDARERAAVDPSGPYARFLREVADNPAWNGVLVLNAPVVAAELPKELRFVTTGIDTGSFFAHHIGFSCTPFDSTADGLVLGQTAAFGLIAYDDPVDLHVEPGGAEFAVKTQHLSARFANSALADFTAYVELMVNNLFGSPLTKRSPKSGNNLLLHGAYQRQNGTASYAFVLVGSNDFTVDRSVLVGVEVLGVQAQTATESVDAGTLSVDFVLDGDLRFAELENADLFSYGPEAALPNPGEQAFDGHLRFSNLVVTLSFPLADPGRQSFTTTYDRLTFDLVGSAARARSLAECFPARLTSAVANPVPDPDAGPRGKTPEDLGYTGVLVPTVDAVLLSPPWFGLEFTLDLGTLGALAGSAGLQATLLVAWSPGTTDEQPVYFGLRLAGADAADTTWPLQGVLKLGFRGFELTTYESSGAGGDVRRGYLLRLRHLALSVLALSLPPGDLDVLVFADPDGTGRTVGWLAAYDGDASATPPPPKTPGRRPRAPRGEEERAMSRMELYVLDVGQGAGNFIQIFDEQGNLLGSVLVDFGYKGTPGSGDPHLKAVDKVIDLLGNRQKIDLLTLSHSDSDHINLIRPLMDKCNNLEIHRVWHGGDRSKYSKGKNKFNIIEFLEKYGAGVRSFSPRFTIFDSPNAPFPIGSHFKIWPLAANTCSPEPPTKRRRITFEMQAAKRNRPDANTESLILLGEIHGHQFILPGDATGVTLTEINKIATDPRFPKQILSNVFILSLPHHGSSKTAKEGVGPEPLEKFAKNMKPYTITASADKVSGKSTDWDHPSAEVIETFWTYTNRSNSGQGNPHWGERVLEGRHFYSAHFKGKNFRYKEKNAYRQWAPEGWRSIQTHSDIYTTLYVDPRYSGDTEQNIVLPPDGSERKKPAAPAHPPRPQSVTWHYTVTKNGVELRPEPNISRAVYERMVASLTAVPEGWPEPAELGERQWVSLPSDAFEVLNSLADEGATAPSEPAPEPPSAPTSRQALPRLRGLP
ncbi:hypothetical protein IHE61_20910 [Streptomyces sp. GKU 257-1]|nr:hypothetical protein [Streptomyces sp. GKU 257-1]